MNPERQNIQIIDFSDAAAKAGFIRSIERLQGRFTIRLSKHRRNRSSQQNRYLWGVVYPMICNGVAEAWGEGMSTDEAHIMCKGMFLSRPVINRHTGEEMARVHPTSKALSVEEFAEYIEKICKFAAESLGCVVPDTEAMTGVVL